MQNDRPIKIIVGSKNPVKLKAAEKAFSTLFPKFTVSVEGVSVPSGVAAQPMSDHETKAGAIERVKGVRKLHPEADFWVGLEGGIERLDGRLWCFAWAIVGSSDQIGEGRSAAFPLPNEISKLVEQGHELGTADDMLFGRVNSKQQDGTVGILTHGALTRLDYYVQPLMLALIPALNRELDFGSCKEWHKP